jgi:hypothetical protein
MSAAHVASGPSSIFAMSKTCSSVTPALRFDRGPDQPRLILSRRSGLRDVHHLVGDVVRTEIEDSGAAALPISGPDAVAIGRPGVSPAV